MTKRRYEKLIDRIHRLPVAMPELGIEEELFLLKDAVEQNKSDEQLFEILEDVVGQVEDSVLFEPFAPVTCSLDNGGVHIADCESGRVCAHIGSGEMGFFHTLSFGRVGYGKTSLLAHIACSLAEVANVILFDSQNQFARFPRVRERFHFALVKSLRWNPYDSIDGVNRIEQIQVVSKGLASCYGWQLGEREDCEAAKELLDRGAPLNHYSVLAHLKTKPNRPGSNRQRFRDTAILHRTHFLDATYPLHHCESGMDMLAVLESGALVMMAGGILNEHRAMILRELFDFVALVALSGRTMSRPLVLIIDEAQELLERPEVAACLLVLRHRGIHIVGACQHPGSLPKEAFGAADLQLALRLMDEKDRRRISEAWNLTREQSAYLTTLPTSPERKAVCFMPSSPMTRAFLVDVPFVESDAGGAVRELPLLETLPWTPIEPNSGMDTRGGMAEDVERFLHDVCNPSHWTSGMRERWVRAGVRSASRQASILKQVLAAGLVRCEDLAIGRGRPVKLCEGTDKAYSLLGLGKPKARGRGKLPTQVASHLLSAKFKKLDGWQVVSEGDVDV